MKRIALFAVLLYSCAACAAPGGPVQEKDKSTTIELSDPAKTVLAAVGKDFTLTLDSNVTTGYRWQPAHSPDKRVVRFVGKKYLASESRLVGAGGVEVWSFKAVGTGTTEISLIYVRPWEKDIPPERKAVFQVSVE